MDITEQKQDEAVNNIIKVYLAQMNSAVKISDIICDISRCTKSKPNIVNVLTI